MKRLHQCLLVATQLVVLLACARLSAPEGWSSGAISGDVLYIGTMEGDVRALDLDSGAAIWKFQLKGAAVYGTPAIAGDRLFVSDYDGHLYGFDLQVWEAGSTGADGALVIQVPESTTAFRVKAKSGRRVGQLTVRFADDGTVEVDADDLDLVVKLRESPRPGGSPMLVVTEPTSDEPVSGVAISIDGLARGTWTKRVGAGTHIVGGPAISNNLVLVGSSDGNLYAFDPDDSSRDWKFATGAELWSTPVVSDGVAYFGSLDHNVYAVRVDDGTELWRFPAKGAVTAAPLIVGGVVYVGSFDSVFYALDAKTGQDVWRFEDASKWFWGGAVAAEDAVVAPSLDGNLYVLDVRTGLLDWSYDTGGPIIGSPAIVGGMVAIPSKDHGVFLIRLRDAEFQDQCVLDGKLRASLTSKDGFIYLAANDRSIRALRVNSAGNLDEQWAHFTGEEDSVQPRWKCG